MMTIIKVRHMHQWLTLHYTLHRGQASHAPRGQRYLIRAALCSLMGAAPLHAS